jgi:hypothetical protein
MKIDIYKDDVGYYAEIKGRIYYYSISSSNEVFWDSAKKGNVLIEGSPIHIMSLQAVGKDEAIVMVKTALFMMESNENLFPSR